MRQERSRAQIHRTYRPPVRLTTPSLRIAAGAGALVVLIGAVAVLVLAPEGHESAAAAIPETSTIVARARADGSDVFVLSDGPRMRLAAGYDDIKGWRVTSTAYVARTEAVVWARVERRGTEVSAVYGRIDGPVPTIVWADGRRQSALAGTDGVYLAVRAGNHRCRSVDGVGAPPTTYSCD